MTWHLVAVFIVGLCMGGLAYLLRKLSRQRLPKWLIPVFAGGGMLGYLAYYDYTWYDFKRSQLPAGAEVIEEHRESSFLKPWSYLHPAVSSFVATDGNFVRRRQENDDIVEYLTYEFSKDPLERLTTRMNVASCASRQLMRFDAKNPQGAKQLLPLDEGDPLYRKICP